jgi:hypothetical protein
MAPFTPLLNLAESEKALWGWWQLAHDTVLSELNRSSKNNILPNATPPTVGQFDVSMAVGLPKVTGIFSSIRCCPSGIGCGVSACRVTHENVAKQSNRMHTSKNRINRDGKFTIYTKRTDRHYVEIC